MFLGSLEAVAATIDRPPAKEVSQALEAALRYFRESAPKHNADEEESLFPRMRAISSAETQPVLAKLDTLEKEHRWAAPLHEATDKIGGKYLIRERLSGEEIEEFRRAVSALAAMYREHIRLEEEIVFPVAAKLPGKSDRTAMAKEMAARRNIRPHSL